MVNNPQKTRLISIVRQYKRWLSVNVDTGDSGDRSRSGRLGGHKL